MRQKQRVRGTLALLRLIFQCGRKDFYDQTCTFKQAGRLYHDDTGWIPEKGASDNFERKRLNAEPPKIPGDQFDRASVSRLCDDETSSRLEGSAQNRNPDLTASWQAFLKLESC